MLDQVWLRCWSGNGRHSGDMLAAVYISANRTLMLQANASSDYCLTCQLRVGQYFDWELVDILTEGPYDIHDLQSEREREKERWVLSCMCVKTLFPCVKNKKTHGRFSHKKSQHAPFWLTLIYLKDICTYALLVWTHLINWHYNLQCSGKFPLWAPCVLQLL